MIKVATVAAGFSPGESDQIRRSMAAWSRRGGLTRFRDRLISGMVARGYDRGFAQQLLRQWSRVPFARVLWVEHRSSETVDPLPGLEQRRYGDTILSGIEFSTDSHVLDGEGS